MNELLVTFSEGNQACHHVVIGCPIGQIINELQEEAGQAVKEVAWRVGSEYKPINLGGLSE